MNGATFIQAARGPVLLMTLGVLLAVHQNTAWGFEQTFPVLIIMFGVMKLIERLMVRPGSDVPPAAPGMSSTGGGQN
jgi:hypothetical protein